jgi:uncharacterized protein YbjT (DUF2867 family)
MKILIVGATGQLGYTICEKLATENNSYKVVATYRKESNTTPLKDLPALELRELDLTNPETFEPALQGVSVVILTANAAAPVKATDSFSAVDEKGVCALIDQAKRAGVIQFIYVSALVVGNANSIPLAKAKKKVEAYLSSVGITYTIFQPAAFMEVYFPFFGTTLPLKGLKVSTVERPFKFSNKFFAGIKNDIEIKGKFNVIGNGETRAAFISVDNVASFCIRAIQRTIAYNATIQIGGPEALSPLDIKAIFEKVYNKELSIKSTPPHIMKMMSRIFRLFNPAAANIFALNYSLAKYDVVVPDAHDIADAFHVSLTTAEEFIKKKYHV